MKYRAFVRIIEAEGFVCDRTWRTHRQYIGTVGGLRRLATVDYAQAGEDIAPRNLASMIRQSALPKQLFR